MPIPFNLAALMLSFTGLALGIGPSYYSCDPTTCTGSCHCPSLVAPGSLNPQETPQFILLTHDDAISTLANTVVRTVTDGRNNPDGCNVVATWFTTSTGTECDLAKGLFDQNHEIALHTVNHKSLTPDLPGMEEEMMGARTALEKCGIPKESMVGFRSPYLVHNPKVREILHKNGLMYDSSIVEMATSYSKTTKSFADRLWPYTMDDGIVQDCNWTMPAGTCTTQEKYPGLWEVPMWPLMHDAIDKPNNAYTMDPEGGFGGDLYTTFTTNFDQAYNGNRAPFPIYLHAPWFTPEHSASLAKFMDYALSKPDVYFVTMKELINWMKNPVNAEQYKLQQNCKKVDVKPLAQRQKCQTYTVQSGDYMESIAGKFGIIDVKELISVNPGENVMGLQPGDVLRIPPWDESCPNGVKVSAPSLPADDTLATQPFQPSESIPTPSPSLQVQNPTASSPMEGHTNPYCKVWTVAAGEYIDGIAKASGVEPAQLVTLNALSGLDTVIDIGQQLKIPPWPACCDTNSCAPASTIPAPAPGQVQLPSTRVDIGFTIQGSSVLNDQLKSQIVDLLANQFKVPADSVSLETVLRRRRKLQQAPPSLYLVTRIATDDPQKLYQSIVAEIRSGDVQMLFSELGLTLSAAAKIKLYKDGEEVAPLQVATIPLNAPPTDTTPPTDQQGDSTFWKTPVIIGISVGGGVALLLIVGILVWFIWGRSRANSAAAAEIPTHKPQIQGAASAEVRLRANFSEKKPSDPCEILVKSGYDTPTTPSQRTFFKS